MWASRTRESLPPLPPNTWRPETHASLHRKRIANHILTLVATPKLVPVPSFEFDPAKAVSNLKKQGVSFDEATTVFDDPLSSTLPDDQHSEGEDRFITVGMSVQQRLLFVVYPERDQNRMSLHRNKLAIPPPPPGGSVEGIHRTIRVVG